MNLHLSPLPVDLQDALVRFVDQRIEAKINCSTGATVATYSQRDGERPIGCGRPKYKRVWHRAFAAHDPDARREGRSLLMSAACWARWCSLPSRAPKPAPTPPPAPVSRVDALLASAGARRTA
jgi:hypothetical protein